ncbi:MAG: sugar phosphate isomerase/epimerase [Marinoscillum sp.]
MKKQRREFIRTSAIAAAAVVVMPSCVTKGSKEAAKAIVAAEQPEIGIGLYTVRDQMAKDPKGTLEKIAKIGYKKIEPFGFDGNKVFGLSAPEMNQICEDLGLKFISGHINPPVFSENWDAALEYMNIVGQKYAVWPWLPVEMRNIETYKKIAETLNQAGEKAKSAGIEVCYHNHDFEFDVIDGQVGLDILANETDPDLVKFELDLYWVSKAGKDQIEQFKKFKGRVPLWHVKDMADTPEKGFAEVGEGTIDYKSIFEAKETSGMKHFFVEQDQSEDPMKSIEISYKNLTEKILA